jgi:hypothetical protein
MMSYGLFGGFLISIVYAGKTDKVPIFDFPDDIDEFNPVIPALYAVTFHHDPPMGVSPENLRNSGWFLGFPLLVSAV